MYGVMLAIEYVGIVTLLFEIVYVMRQRYSYLQSLMLVLLISILANFAGYLFELTAKDMHSALLGVKFAYLGKPYIVLSIFLFVMGFCKVHIPRWVQNILIAIHVIITLLVITCESNTLYYRSIGYTVEGTYPHLVLEHGIVYYMYEGLVVIFFVMIVAAGVKRLRKTRDSLIREQVKFFMVMVVICVVGYSAFLSGWTRGYDTTVPAYFICVQMLLIVMMRYELFDTLSLAREDAVDRMPEGIVVFDNDQEAVYMNRNAAKLQQYIEKKKLGEFYQVLTQLEQQKEHLIVDAGEGFVGDRSDYGGEEIAEQSVYHISGRKTVKNNRCYGTTYVISDETDSYYYTERLERDVRKKTAEVIQMQRSIIGSFATMIEARDGITGLHIKNTSNFVRVLVRAMHKDSHYRDIVTAEYAKMVAEAAKLHDIGKISIPDQVLQKPGKLTEDEFAIMKTHPAEGARIIRETLGKLENDEYVTIAYDMAYYHHEKYAGGGYPCNLQGEQIPLSARIMAICDVYDALRSKRHYKEGYSREKAEAIIRESRGIHFDPIITDIFLEHIGEMEAVFVQNT